MLLPGSARRGNCSTNDRNGQNQYQQQQLNSGGEPNDSNARFRFHVGQQIFRYPYARVYELERMGPNSTTKIRGENAKIENSKLGGKSEATSTAVVTGTTDTEETKENINTNGESGENPGSNTSLPNSQQGYDTGGGYGVANRNRPQRAQPAHLGGMIDNYP